jgi:hypothetical protein
MDTLFWTSIRKILFSPQGLSSGDTSFITPESSPGKRAKGIVLSGLSGGLA